MDGEEMAMLQRSADIIKAEVGDITPEAVAAFLFILSQDQITIHDLATSLLLQPDQAARSAVELGAAGLINVALEGDMFRVISLNEKSRNFALRLGYVLRS